MATPRLSEVRAGDFTIAGNFSPSATSRVLDDLVPSPDASQDLGTAALRWRTIYAQTLSPSRLVSGGTALVAGNFALSSGWGSTATISALSGTDSAWRLTVTANGAGIATNPTLTLTFANGAWAATPFGMSKMVGGTAFHADTSDSLTTTTWVITLLDLPVAGDTYIIQGIAIG